MNKLVHILCLFGATVLIGCSGQGQRPSTATEKLVTDDQLIVAALQRLEKGLAITPDSNQIPRAVEHDGSIRGVKSSDWTSGFFPGNLWLAYGYTNDPRYREQAEKWTAFIEKEKHNNRTHDMGFKVNCSFGQGYALTQNPHYKAVLIKSAETLMTRYNPKIGSLRSWDHNRDKWEFPVIIDNMLNLELLFLATRFTGDSSFYKVAHQHALTTMQHHFRSDYSTFHVVDYDPVTGKVKSKATHQGYADGSSWARGQAWALYGYTMAYRETGDKRFLELAENIGQFILNHKNLPADMVPYWDFDAPNIPDAPRDASAAAVIASAFYELSTYSAAHTARFKTAADQIMAALSSDAYLVPATASHPFILRHSTGNLPKNDEIDVPISYADYYYLEALLRKKNGFTGPLSAF
ncbi:glycoside hydrolase family 88 protein [Pontibacter beigongshangensis]|uniref:glycoside hydrolase family 88 protein n=1 Tax=Pontibacter beigongshangensis TaxID=2574733 RepID=UPI00164FF0BC|nr:glycoside hydrolase family 88 protein [Pontibacter beigongshangensis]